MDILDQIIECINNDQIEEALELILENEQILDGYTEFWNAKAVLCIKMKEYDTAKVCLKNILRLDSTNADAYYNLAFVHEQQGFFSDAAIFYGLAEKHAAEPELKEELGCLYSDDKALYDIKNIAAQTSRRAFIILSSCPWGDVLQRMHHISRSLARLGQDVVYISPASDMKVNSENINFDAVVDAVIKNKREVNEVSILQPMKLVFNGRMIFNSYVSLVQKIIDSVTDGKEVVLVAYMPFQVEVIKKLKGNFKVIYECVDDHSDTEYSYWGAKKDIVWEQELMDIAHSITTSSTALYLQRVSVEGRSNVYLSRNAVNEADFASGEIGIPEDLTNIPEPRIVYTGAISEWFDAKLFYDVVKSNPDKSFVVIGFEIKEMLKEKCPNLYFLGVKKHSELNNYLRHMQVGIIPFKDNSDIIINCDPIKQYEYLACGLPVITTFMPESVINKVYTVNANTKDEFNKALESHLIIDVDKQAINEFVLENSWNSRAVLLCRILDNKADDESIHSIMPKLENRLLGLADTNSHPNFLILYSLAINGKDKARFLDYSKKAYEASKIKYIERQHLYALCTAGQAEDFISTAVKSEYIAPCLAAEILYRKASRNTKIMGILMNYCIRNYGKALELGAELGNQDDRNLFEGYYYFLIGEDQRVFSIIKDITAKLMIHSPLYVYLLGYVFKMMGNEKEHEGCMQRFLELEKKYLGKVKSKPGAFPIPNINLNKDPFISLIIPTRNSANVLRHALQTCIEQNYDNFEIIVSDNSSPGNEETKRLIDEINCKRIKYYRTSEELALKDNFNFAYSKANGEYMMILGSDDGLFLHCLEKLPGIINDLSRPMSISWDVAAYGWPDVEINSIRNGLFIPYLTQKNNAKCSYYDETVLKSVLGFKTRYSALPMFYYNSIIKRELAEEAKKAMGELFYSTPPDVYTGIVFAYLQKKYIHLNMPMSIGGSSGKSLGITGANPIYGSSCKNDEPTFELSKLQSMGMDYATFFAPLFAGEDGSVVIAGTIAKKVFFAERSDLNIDRKSFFEACVKNLYNDENFEKKKNELFSCIKNYGEVDLIRWYEENYMHNRNFKGFKNLQNNALVPGFREDGRLVLDTSKFDVKDVFAAAQLYRNIIGY